MSLSCKCIIAVYRFAYDSGARSLLTVMVTDRFFVGSAGPSQPVVCRHTSTTARSLVPTFQRFRSRRAFSRRSQSRQSGRRRISRRRAPFRSKSITDRQQHTRWGTLLGFVLESEKIWPLWYAILDGNERDSSA